MNIHKGAEVLRLLVGNYGWSIHGEDFDSIIYDSDIKPITKEEFEDGLANLDNLLAKEKSDKEAKRITALAKFEALGFDEDNLKALGL